MTPRHQILELEKTLIRSMKNGDFDMLDKLLHDDLLFVIPEGHTVTKEVDLNHFKSGALILAEIAIKDAMVSVIEDNAIVSTEIFMKGAFNDRAFEGSFKYLRVWKSFKKEWKVIGGAGLHLSHLT